MEDWSNQLGDGRVLQNHHNPFYSKKQNQVSWAISIYPYDIEVLTGLAETPPLPSWLADYQPSTVAESRTTLKKTKPRGLATAIGSASHEGPLADTVRLVEGLNSCNSLVEIRTFLRSLGTKVEQEATHSRLAFFRLLGARVPLQTLLEFLDDASLNVLEAQNLQELLGRLARRAPDDLDSEALGNWMRRHISLGRLPEKDIGSVLNSACHLGSRAYHHNLGSLIATSVWDGIQSSSVLRPKDLEAKTVNTLLEHISRNEWSEKIQSIGNSIVRSLPISLLHNVQSGIAAFMRSCLLAMRTSTGIRGQELPLSEDSAAMAQFIGILPTKVASATLEMVITKELMTTRGLSQECPAILARIVHLLEILPAQVADSSVASATSNICLGHQQALRKGQGRLELLELWFQTLSKSDKFRQSTSCSVEWRTFEKGLSERRIETPYLRGLSDRERCRFILRHWALEDVGEQNVGQTPSVVSDTLSCFEGLNQTEHGTAPYGHMLRALRNHITSFDKIIIRLFSLLSSLGESQTTVNVIRRMQKYRLPIDARTLSFVIKAYSRSKPASALTLFESHAGLSLAGCPELAESVIADPGTGPDTVFRHLGLDRQTRAVLNRGSSYQGASLLSRAQIQLLHRMALAFANAAHLKPRIAFRFVHRCYMILKRGSGGDFRPQLSRALTVAGIIRPLTAGQWVSTMKLRWILALVKDIEGEEIAIELDQTVYEWRGQVVRCGRVKPHYGTEEPPD